MTTVINSVPVLTGDVAERFVGICEYNSQHLASSEYSEDREKWVKEILSKAQEHKSDCQ